MVTVRAVWTVTAGGRYDIYRRNQFRHETDWIYENGYLQQMRSYGRYQVFMTYMYFSFFFIPLFKWNRRFYVKMSCCGAVYELDPEKGKALARVTAGGTSPRRTWPWSREGNRRSSYENGSYRYGRNVCAAAMRQKRILSTVLNAAGDCDGRRCTDGSRREISSPCWYETEPRIFSKLQPTMALLV